MTIGENDIVKPCGVHLSRRAVDISINNTVLCDGVAGGWLIFSKWTCKIVVNQAIGRRINFRSAECKIKVVIINFSSYVGCGSHLSRGTDVNSHSRVATQSR